MNAASKSPSVSSANAGSDQTPDTDSNHDPFLDGAGFFPGLPPGYGDCTDRSAVVGGGAVAGLAAAHALLRAGYDVTLAER